MTRDEHLTRRLERCSSWIEKAEDHGKDPDMAFVCLWIAFNALYGYEIADPKEKSDSIFRSEFFKKICEKDENKKIYKAIWQEFSDSIRTLTRNQFAYKAYWQSRNEEISEEEYKTRKRNDDQAIGRALKHQRTAIILEKLFERLYVLRNQLMHGGATYNSKRNRNSIGDGHKILLLLVPEFLEIIEENSDIELGKPYYFEDE